MEKFPKLKLNLAHFGGYETWSKPSKVTHNGQARKETIFEFMEKYENVFADFSYNLIETDLSKSLREVLTAEKKIRERTLFGTDYWVVSKEGDLLKEQREFLTIMDDNFSALKLSELLTVDNPKKYLFWVNLYPVRLCKVITGFNYNLKNPMESKINHNWSSENPKSSTESFINHINDKYYNSYSDESDKYEKINNRFFIWITVTGFLTTILIGIKEMVPMWYSFVMVIKILTFILPLVSSFY